MQNKTMQEPLDQTRQQERNQESDDITPVEVRHEHSQHHRKRYTESHYPW